MAMNDCKIRIWGCFLLKRKRAFFQIDDGDGVRRLLFVALRRVVDVGKKSTVAVY